MSTERTLSPAAQKNLAFVREHVDPAIDLSRACEVLAAAGLRIVDQAAIEVKPDVWQAVVTIAGAALKSPETIRRLVWED